MAEQLEDVTPITSEINTEVPKSSSIINVQFSETKTGNFKIKSDSDMFSENYYREPQNLFDGNEYERFVEGCEDAIRKSEVYNAYIAYLKNEIGLTRDAFNGEITHDNASIEMHHGPIFTLYDYCRILIDYSFDMGLPVSTFTIGKLVMNEHTCNRVQVVMLTKNNHKLVHVGKLFVDFRQCHGSLKEFIKIYHSYIERSPVLLRKIATYKSLMESRKIQNSDILHIDSIINWSPKSPHGA